MSSPSSDRSLRLSIVVPFYDEAGRLAGPVGELIGFAEASGGEVELVFVDDGSRDGGGETVRARLAASRLAEGEGWRLLVLPENRGKGAAVRAGMLAARGERVLFTDVDLSTPLADLPRLEAALDAGAAVAIGSRAVAGSRIVRSQPLVRSLGGKAINLFVRLLAVPGIHDTQCGFKLFTRQAARDVFSRAALDGFSFDVEALFLARRLGHRVAEIPVSWADVDGSKVSPFADGLRLLADLVRIRRRALSGGYARSRSAPD